MFYIAIIHFTKNNNIFTCDSKIDLIYLILEKYGKFINSLKIMHPEIENLYVWKQNMLNWEEVGKLIDLQPLFGSTPPPIPSFNI